MNYIKQLNAYWNWVKLNELPSRAGYLYFAILDCANAAGWKSEFNAPNSTLQAMAGLGKTDLCRYRNLLIQAGLIYYAAGKRGAAGTYRIRPLYGTNPDTNPDTNMLPIPEPICGPYLNKNGNRNKTKTIPPPPTPSADPDVAEVIRAWNRASGRCMTMAESDRLLELLDTYGKDRLLYAISQGVDNSAVKVSYIQAVLEGRGKKQSAAQEEEERRRREELAAWMQQED